jgi:2-phosphosulfolactate phosphatase
MMDIQILHLLEGARQAKGLTVVIDVFRAFSLACYMAEKNPAAIIPVADINKAYELKKEHPAYILVGERNERIPEGFDFGNSPTHILDQNLTGRTIIHTTSAGTQGLVNATGAELRLTGSFVNAPAIVTFIRKLNPETVSLVCMGYSMKRPSEEDTLCAEYIKAQLNQTPFNFQEAKNIIRNTSALRLFEPANQDFSPSTDFDYCMDIGRFNFVLEVQQAGNLISLKKICL